MKIEVFDVMPNMLIDCANIWSLAELNFPLTPGR
jgi:hypothetical protein